jgi:hypothetical protein
MESKQIILGTEVMVSDPCYTEPTWCQVKLKNVKPGKYCAFHKEYDAGDWGVRSSMIMVIHEEHILDQLKWKLQPGEVGVDSGQAGIFSYETYRKDGIEMDIPSVGYDGKNFDWLDSISREDEVGEDWYKKMCKITLSEIGWGTYSNGIVSRSGFGDGGYQLFTAKSGRKIVAMAVDFAVEEGEFIDFNWYREVYI